MGTSDAAVIGESLADPGAFAAIFDRHAMPLLRFLTRRVEPADAESLLGEVFRIAFERRVTFDATQESARPWLYGIATNLVARHHRSEARRLRALNVFAAQRIEQPDLADVASGNVDARSTWSALVDVVNELPDVERDTLLLYAWEELSYADIATVLGVPIGTVRSRLNRVRSRLRATENVGARQRLEDLRT
jgi:RNA polymerase sigma-70 factor (ECF subfamily)